MYGRSKPKENDKILFYCQRGLRSKKAMEKAIQMGFIKYGQIVKKHLNILKHSDSANICQYCSKLT